MNLSALRQFIKTKEEVTGLITLIESLKNQLFKNDFDIEDFLSKNSSSRLSGAFVTFFKTNNIGTDNKNELADFLIKTIEQLRKIPVVHIMLAFQPKDSLINSIEEWFYDNLGNPVILDISTDPKIIGASIISFNGRANDYSLANKIDQMK